MQRVKWRVWGTKTWDQCRHDEATYPKKDNSSSAHTSSINPVATKAGSDVFDKTYQIM